MTRKQWDELLLKVGAMPLDELEKIMAEAARKVGVSQTNADRIRGMTDEELAEWLGDVSKSWYDEGYTKDDESPLMSGYPATANEWIEWLKSPVEEADK